MASGLDVPTFASMGRLSGLVPTVGIAAGRCFAGNAALLGCCDVIIATRDSTIGMGGPAMIEGGGLGVFAPEEVGPIEVQGSNGVVDVVVDDEAELIAVDLTEPGVHVAEAHGVGARLAVEHLADHLGLGPDPVVLDADLRLGADVGDDEGDPARTVLGGQPVPHRVLHERLDREVGQLDGEDLGGDLQGDAQTVAEPCLLEHEVALHVAQLVGEGGEVAAATQGIPAEVGEVEDELACAVRIGSYERRDGAQRVVDEMRTDLCA